MRQQPQKGIPMDPDVFESQFAQFWESRECDDLNQVIYDLIKAAYAAGCRAAGAEPPAYPRHVRLTWKVHKTKKPGPRSKKAGSVPLKP